MVQNNLNVLLDDYNKTTLDVSKTLEQEYTNLAEEIIKKGLISLHIPENDNLDFENSTVRQVNDKYYSVTINYNKDPKSSHNSLSGVSLVFDGDKNIVEYFEMKLKELDSNSGQITAWHNGEEGYNDVVTVEGTEGDITTQSWSGFVDCLNNQGVSAWAVAALGIACGALCAGTAGAGCAPCLYAASSITGGTLGWCIGSNL